MPAVDRKLLDQFQFADLFFNREKFKQLYQREITLGEIGCTLSHLSCYQAISENKAIRADQFVIIAEDDIQLSPHFSAYLSQFLYAVEMHPENYAHLDLIILNQLFRKATEVEEGRFFLFDQFRADGIDDVGSALYLIRKSCAEKVTARMRAEKAFWLADHFSLFIPAQNAAVLLPFLGEAPDPNTNLAQSDLEQERKAMRNGL